MGLQPGSTIRPCALPLLVMYWHRLAGGRCSVQSTLANSSQSTSGTVESESIQYEVARLWRRETSGKNTRP